MQRALVIDGRPKQGAARAAGLSARGFEVSRAVDLQEAVDALTRDVDYALVIVCVDTIEAGVWVAGVAAQARLPTPLVVVATVAKSLDAAAGFQLGRFGVRRLMAEPVDLDVLLREISAAREEPLPELEPLLAPFLGRLGLFELEREVRRAVVRQAVARSGDNRSRAARLLRAPRPVIQRVAPRKPPE